MNVQQVAALAKLAIPPEEETRMENEFEQMLAFVQQMHTAETVKHSDMQGGTLRPDEPRPCLDRAAMLALAPERKDEYISVPKSFD